MSNAEQIAQKRAKIAELQDHIIGNGNLADILLERDIKALEAEVSVLEAVVHDQDFFHQRPEESEDDYDFRMIADLHDSHS